MFGAILGLGVDLSYRVTGAEKPIFEHYVTYAPEFCVESVDYVSLEFGAFRGKFTSKYMVNAKKV